MRCFDRIITDNILDKITSQKLYHSGIRYLIWHITINFLAFVEIPWLAAIVCEILKQRSCKISIEKYSLLFYISLISVLQLLLKIN